MDKNKQIKQLKNDIRQLGDFISSGWNLDYSQREYIRKIMNRNNFYYSEGEMGYVEVKDD